jgi:hypothetical protein
MRMQAIVHDKCNPGYPGPKSQLPFMQQSFLNLLSWISVSRTLQISTHAMQAAPHLSRVFLQEPAYVCQHSHQGWPR